jgi:hypothetical protein
MTEDQKRSEEIDLLYFLRPINRGARKVYGWGEHYVRLLLHNALLFLAIVILITGFAYSTRYFIPKAYKVEGIFVSHILPAKYCGMMISNLNQLLGDENISAFAQHVNLPPDIAGQIAGLRVEPLRDTFFLEKKDSALALFKIVAILTSTDNIEKIQDGVVYYLENSEYAKNRKEARIKMLNQIQDTLTIRLKGLDSLKKLVNSSIVPRGQGQGIILGTPIDPVNVYNTEINYFREMMRTNETLSLMDNIEVVQPFLKRLKYNHPNFTKYLIYGFLASVLTALVVVPLFGRKLKRVE